MLTDNQPTNQTQRIVVGRKTQHASGAKPEISIEKTGQVISKIIVRCCCSEEIIINCHYETVDSANE